MRGLEIKANLSSFGTTTGSLYTRQEKVDRLKEFQSAIAREACGAGNESLRSNEIAQAVETRANALGLQDSENLTAFKEDMQELGCEIGLTIAGLSGEHRGFRALKPLEHDRDTYVLRNICLTDGDEKTEIDSLVVSPYGIFVIEIKNWRGGAVITKDGFLQKANNPECRYSLGERMCRKELLVREALKEDPDVLVCPMLFLVDGSIVDDQFGEVPVANRNTIVYKIRSYAHAASHLSPDQVSDLVERIQASHTEEKYPCAVDCERIADDFAALMDEMELAELARATKEDKAKNFGVLYAELATALSNKKQDLQRHALRVPALAGIAGCAIAAFWPAAFASLKTTK